MNPRNRTQQVVTIFDGRVHQVALCRGFLDGLPVFGWGESPPTLFTRSQLRSAELCRAGQDPLALLVFRHIKPYRRETVAELFSVELAKPKRIPSTAQLRALRRAMEARRVCVDCAQVKDYCVPTSTRQCWDCFDTEQGEVAA